MTIRRVRGAAGAAALLALACGPARPDPFVRIVAVEPAGPVDPTAAAFEVTFSGAVDAGGVADASRIALVREEDVRAAAAAVDSDEGSSGPPAIPVRAELTGDGVRARLEPLAPLVPDAGHAVVVSSRLRDTSGRPVLDPDGRRRTFVHLFRTGPAPGPPPAPVILEVRARAATPEAGGEYVEIANLGAGPLDLRSYRLGKRTSSGTLATCAIEARDGGPIPPRGFALVAGGAWDGRYALPPGTARYACGATALAGGIADGRPPEILLLSPGGEAASSLGAGGVAPMCDVVERIHPLGPDAAGNLACAEEGTPGACNAATPSGECP